MKTSFKLFLSVASLGLAVAPLARAADAQDTPPPTVQVPIPAAPDASDTAAPAAAKGKGKGERPMRGGPAGDNLKAMKEKLNLTADQETKIKGIYKNHADELKAAKGDRAKAAEVMKAQRAEVRAVLNADQQKTFDSMAPGAGHGRGKGKKKGDA